MKHKLQSNDFLKNEINEMVKKKEKTKTKTSLWFAFFGVCTVFVFVIFICFEQYLNYVVRH